MKVYCFKCRHCGATYTSPDRVLEGLRSYGAPKDSCVVCDTTLVRDYKAEAVGVGTGVAMSRTGTVRDQAQLFLPSNDEFKGPGDPDGTKGAREWLDSHAPKENGGHNPLLDIERRSF